MLRAVKPDLEAGRMEFGSARAWKIQEQVQARALQKYRGRDKGRGLTVFEVLRCKTEYKYLINIIEQKSSVL